MDAKLKHLEFVQAIINRMATNQFLFKGWAITVAAALSGFAAVDSQPGLIIIALVATGMFWLLDGYYLWLERAFRTIYASVAAKSPETIDFGMTPDKSKAWQGLLTAYLRRHNLLFYGGIVIIDAAAIFLVRSK